MDVNRFLIEVLPFVEKPSRYTGGEYNSILKEDRGLLRVALAFPDVYEIGMSNHGLEIIYHILNSLDFVWAERVYLPWTDMIEKMRERGVPLFTLESRTPVEKMDILGISLEYELSYTNVIELLKLSRIPVRSEERKESDPLVIAGGPLAGHVEPIAPAFDAVLLGDGEEAVVEIARTIYETRGMDRHSRLKELSKIKGVYVPIFYEVRGRRVVPKFEGIPKRVEKRILRDLDSFSPPLRKVVPFLEVVHDRAVVEIMRGCTRGCRFCHAGMYYRPVRERDPDKIVEWSVEMLDSTGYEELSLLSLSTMDYSGIDSLVEGLMKELSKRKVALSLPSTRVDRFGVEIASKIAGVRKTGLTFAPEAGTERLRAVINKNITEEDIFSTAEAALRAGWRRIKLYFMMGLPTETEEDLKAMVDLIRRIKRMGFKDLTAAVSVFVPKPHTPFQFSEVLSPEEAFERQRIIKRARRFAKVDFHDPRMSFIEAVLSRGGRELFEVIVTVNDMGQVFDEWREMFSYERWMKAFETVGIDPGDYKGPFEVDAPFPWDHLYIGIDRDFLVREYEKALAAQQTEDCRWGRCSLCGVCFRMKVFNLLKGSQGF